MNAYNTLFFDLDHTLWDFEANSRATLWLIYQQFDLARLGIADFDRFHAVYREHNERLWQRYRKGFINRETLKWKRMWLALIDFKIGNEALAKELALVFITELPKQTILFPHCVEMLDYCQSKSYGMHLITNGFEDTQWKKISACGLAGYFGAVVTSEQSQSVKPHRAIFEYALNAAQADAGTSLMIGDNLEVDILGAQNAGIDQVFFNPDRVAHKELPTFEIQTLNQILDIL